MPHEARRASWRSGRTRYRTLAAVMVSLTMAACDSGSEPEAEIEPPIARVGANRNVPLGERVTLSGGASSDPQFLYLQYAWAFLSRPAGSDAVLEHASEPIATFVPDAEGLYAVTLTVNNGHLSNTDTVRLATAPGDPEVLNRDIENSRRLQNLYMNPFAADYVMTVPVEVTARLTIDEGVRIETRGGTTLTIGEGGSLQAIGTAEQPIQIEGMKQRRGYWRGLEFLAGSGENTLVHADVGNGGGPEDDELANLYVRSGAALALRNSLIRESSTWGVFVESGGQFEGTDNTFRGNALGDVNQ